jgi:hypothetical protein
MSIEAMKQALDALALFASDESDEGQMAIAAHEALRQAIEQAEKREWVELAGDEVIALCKQFLKTKGSNLDAIYFARAIEAEIKEKNYVD